VLPECRGAGIITTNTMMATLLNWQNTFGYVPTLNRVTTDSHMTGDWDGIDTSNATGRMVRTCDTGFRSRLLSRVAVGCRYTLRRNGV